MATRSIRWLRGIAVALVAAIAILALLWVALFWWRRLSLPWDNRLAVAIVVPAFAFVWAIWWLWWRLPQWQAARLRLWETKVRADTEDNFRKTVGQALGGVAVLIGAVAAYLQFTQQQQAYHELLISNQVSKGFEQLASDKIAERLGGIYALEGVMNTSDQYHQPVLEALCAFVRYSTTHRQGTLSVWLKALLLDTNEKTADKVNDKPSIDVQAALTVIGRRNLGPEPEFGLTISTDRSGSSPGGVDLTGANIPGANLLWAHLEFANLDRAHLERAFLVAAHLQGAGLAGANLSSANLTDADVRSADLRSADLRGADLELANLSDTYLSGAYMDGAELSGSNNLTQEQLDEACGKPKTLPSGLHLDKPCPPPSAGSR